MRMLQVRRLLAQGEAEDWGLASLLPSLRRLRPLPPLPPVPPALGMCRRWDCSAGSASSLLQGRKGAPASSLWQCHHWVPLGEYGNMNSLLSPSGIFLAPLSHPQYFAVLPSSSAADLK